MKMFSAIILAAIAMAEVNAVGVPPPGVMVFQIQPTPGTIGSFQRTPCLTVPLAVAGSPLVIRDCTGTTEQRAFEIVQGGSNFGAGPPGPISIFNTFCLEVIDGVDADGTKVHINPCVTGNPNQTWRWNSNGTITWAGHDKCLDLTNGDITNDNQMQIFTCFPGNKNQIWSANTLQNPLNKISLASQPNICIGANSSANGAPVFVTSCADTTSRKVWKLPQVGHGNSGIFQLSFGIDSTPPIKCLDVTDGKAQSGTKLQLWDCTANNINQQFIPTTTIRWLGTSLANGLCVDLTKGVINAGNQLQISNCTLNDVNQEWTDIIPAQNDV